MLGRLSIPLRQLLLLAVPLAALLIVALGGLASINAAGDTTDELRIRLATQSMLEDLRGNTRYGLLDPIAAVQSGKLTAARALERSQRAQQLGNQLVNNYLSALPGSSRARNEASLQTVLKEFRASYTRVQQYLKAADAAGTLPEGQIETTITVAIDALTGSIDQQRQMIEHILKASRERDQALFYLNAALGVGGLALALWFGYFIGRSITRPVQQITNTVHAVASGNLEARVRLDGFDEIAGLGNALDHLLDEKVATLARIERENSQLNDSIIALLRAVSRLSQRDLTVRVPVTEDVTGPVADAINQLAAETGRVLADVSHVADQVAAASAQVKTKAESVSAVANNQQTEALATADKLRGAAERLGEIAKLAQHCDDLAQRASQNTEAAATTVTGTLNGMTSIRDVIQETGKRIKRLGERSQEINGIVDIINKIAERTTVLALNASMQAAAAGDAGRGFGVVADEVQRLAESTRNAAGQIGTLIKGMQVETHDTMGTMERAIGQVVEGSKMAEAAGRQMGDTQGTTSALVTAVQQIAASSKEQAALSVTLLDRAQTIIGGVRTTGEHVNDQLNETVNLTDFSRQLLESVRVFKLPDAA
jgi:methyl-accepting chemotaxis protein